MYHEQLASADRSALQSLGVLFCRLTLRVADTYKSAAVRLTVVRDLGTEFILGQDLAGPLKMVIDCHAGEVQFKTDTDDSQKPLDVQEDHSSTAAQVQGPVDIYRQQVVKAMTETLVEGQVPTTEPVFLGGFEPSESTLMIGNSIDTPVNGRVHFLALNPHARDVTIGEGQRVSTWESLARGGP